MFLKHPCNLKKKSPDLKIDISLKQDIQIDELTNRYIKITVTNSQGNIKKNYREVLPHTARKPTVENMLKRSTGKDGEKLNPLQTSSKN